MKLPTHQDFYLPTLKALDLLGGSASNTEIDATVSDSFGFTPEQLALGYPTSGFSIILDRIAWARSYLKYPGLLDNPKRKMWVLTEEGREAVAFSEDKVREIVDIAAKADTKAKKEQKDAGIAKSKAAEKSPLYSGEQNQIEAIWSEALLAKLRGMDPFGFERLCQRLLRESGFTKVQVTKKTGDGGIDGQGVLRMNLVSFHVLFQCKRYKGTVGAPEIRDFRGAMQGRADKGLIITTGSFTPEAGKEATRDGAPAIDLIDGETLCELLRDQKLGVTIKLVEVVTVDDAFFDEI
jgi:restriction system protein